MAKTPSGLPDSFDIKVTASDLAGPASLPGYLDEDPVMRFANLQKQQPGVNAPVKAEPLSSAAPTVPARVVSQVAPIQKETVESVPMHPAKVAAAPIDRKRFQINLDVASERMLEELLELLSSQSSGDRIKTSELFQALLMTLYNAKGEIALGSLPTRGRWGSPTAKAFPVNLAESLREAIVIHESVSGGNPFKKVVSV